MSKTRIATQLLELLKSLKPAEVVDLLRPATKRAATESMERSPGTESMAEMMSKFPRAVMPFETILKHEPQLAPIAKSGPGRRSLYKMLNKHMEQDVPGSNRFYHDKPFYRYLQDAGMDVSPGTYLQKHYVSGVDTEVDTSFYKELRKLLNSVGKK